MMKKILFLLCLVLLIGGAAGILFNFDAPEEYQRPLKDDIDVFFEKYHEKIPFQDPATTEELKSLLGQYDYAQTPRIYIRNFPSDFHEKADTDTFVRTLLPYLLRENEVLQLERAVFLKIANKIRSGQSLSSRENAFFQSLVLKYEVVEPDAIGQIHALYHKIDRISPALAIAQALYATHQMKENLNAPFDVFRWNKDKKYERVIYPNLAQAVRDYALEINRGQSYEMYHNQRSIYRDTPYDLPADAFLDGLSLYKKEESDYTRKIRELLDLIDDYHIDMAKLKKGV